MDNAGLWVSIIIVMFVLGSIFGLRVSPREKALGALRDKARQMGLHPRLVAAPEWTKVPKATETRASMVAYYSVVIPEGVLPLTRAVVIQNQLNVVQGNDKLNGTALALQGIYAIDMQANYVGVYWNEETDLHGTQLSAIKDFLVALAAR